MTGVPAGRTALLLPAMRLSLLLPAALNSGLPPTVPVQPKTISSHANVRLVRAAVAVPARPVPPTGIERGTVSPVAPAISRIAYSFAPLRRSQVALVLRHYGSPFQNAWVWSVMIGAAQQYNVSPYLMLAVAWQEQSLADPRIAAGSWLDPWNAGVSWQDWTGSYQEAADLAARDLRAKLDAPGRPAGMGAIRWIEDPANPAGMWAISQGAGGHALPTPGWVMGVRQAVKWLREDRVPE